MAYGPDHYMHHYADVDPAETDGPDSILLIWDAPNLDMGLGTILGGRPNSGDRPRFDAVGTWLLNRAAKLTESTGTRIVPEATVFTNVTPGSAEQIRGWVEALRNFGFAVFAKPKLSDDSDVDPNMLAHIRRRHAEGVLTAVVVASADGQNFQEDLETLAADGVQVTVIGFREHCSWAIAAPDLEFIDLEDIAGVFLNALPRLSLDTLPDEGGWLPPFRPLTCLHEASAHDS